ncbi:MAG: TRAP transporter large permease, partial [Desulfuromonadales bacterium]
MSVEVLTILMFLTLMASIALGHPLAVTLAAVATLFGLIDNGFDISALLGLFANNAWGIFLNYTLVAIPLFIFMAQILDRSKVSEGLFDALYQVLGGLRGGLGMAVIVVSTVFAATTGIIGASVVAMGLMAGPALLRRGYNRGLGAGIICASGTLGILIPPSIMLVVYGGLTGQKETSVGNLFAAAILPGLLLSGLYLLYVGVRCYMNPKMGPPIPKEDRTATLGEKFAMTMKNFVPPFGLILTVMGTILAGVATPTEAAALGCVGALILALATKKLNWEVITQACISTARTTAMIMALFIGGKFFSVVFLSMGGGDVVADVLLGMDV